MSSKGTIISEKEQKQLQTQVAKAVVEVAKLSSQVAQIFGTNEAISPPKKKRHRRTKAELAAAQTQPEQPATKEVKQPSAPVAPKKTPPPAAKKANGQSAPKPHAPTHSNLPTLPQ